MKPLSARTGTFTDSVIRRMTRVCNQCDAVNLSQGFPDFDPPQPLLDRLAQVSREGPHQYAVTWGRRTSAKPWPPSRAISWACPSTQTARCWSPAVPPRP